MPVYEYKCLDCKEEFDERIDYELRDMLQMCPACGMQAGEREIRSFPGITRASFIDGTKRKGIDELKRIAKLEQQKADLAPGSEEREGMNKEIRELRKVPKDKGGSN